MIIEVARIPLEGGRYEGDEQSSILGIEPEGDFTPKGPIHYDLTVRLVTGELLVSGNLKMRVGLCCSRCGGAFDAEIAEPKFNCDRAIKEPTQSVDLTDDIREAMLLAFPLYPLCGPDCKGLCSQCGMNLNKKECGCRPPVDLRWSDLDKVSDFVKHGATFAGRKEEGIEHARTKKKNIKKQDSHPQAVSQA